MRGSRFGADHFCDDVAALGDGAARESAADGLHQCLERVGKREDLATAEVEKNVGGIDQNIARRKTLLADGGLADGDASHENNHARPLAARQ